MNKCIFCGNLVADPTQGLISRSNNKMCKLVLRLRRKDFNGNWSSTLVEVFCFGNRAEYAEKYMYRGMKMIAICYLETVRCPFPPELGKRKGSFYLRPLFILDEFFCPVGKEPEDYAEDRDEVVFSGLLGETLVDLSKWHKEKRTRNTNDFVYKDNSNHYNDKPACPTNDDKYYESILDEIVENADLSDVEKEIENNPTKI